MDRNKILIVMIIGVAIIALAIVLYYSRSAPAVSSGQTIQTPNLKQSAENISNSNIQKESTVSNTNIQKESNIPIQKESTTPLGLPEPVGPINTVLPTMCDADMYLNVVTNITCPANKRLQFTKVLYGVKPGSKCQDSDFVGCPQVDFTSQANALIFYDEFKQIGSVSSWPGFTDPCVGIQKQADIEYTCT